MFTNQQLVKVAKFIEEKFVGDFCVSFAKGFEDTYVIIETERDSREGRQVFSLTEILSEG